MTSRRVSIAVALAAAASAAVVVLACDGDGDGDGGPPPGNLEYYCAHEAVAWCPAYADCDPSRFAKAFTSVEQCAEQRALDCLEPPAGFEPCLGATEDETDGCVAYLESNHPDGCQNLFGLTADMSPCESICE